MVDGCFAEGQGLVLLGVGIGIGCLVCARGEEDVKINVVDEGEVGDKKAGCKEREGRVKQDRRTVGV